MLSSLGRDNGHLVIAGAGWIGLEVAAAARGYGAEVTVVEPEPTPLHAVLGPELGEVFADLHRDHGVRFHFGARLTEIAGQDGMVLAVRTDDGEEHPAHDVLAAIGAGPADRPRRGRRPGARRPPAEGGGIAVDAGLRTSDPDIFAAGDVASVQHPLVRRPAAGRALGERPERRPGRRPRDARPARGLRPGAVLLHRPVRPGHGVLRLRGARLVRPGGGARRRRASGEFIAFWLSEGRVLAGMNVNVWDVTDPLQRLIRSGRPVDPERLADPRYTAGVVRRMTPGRGGSARRRP